MLVLLTDPASGRYKRDGKKTQKQSPFGANRQPPTTGWGRKTFCGSCRPTDAPRYVDACDFILDCVLCLCGLGCRIHVLKCDDGSHQVTPILSGQCLVSIQEYQWPSSTSVSAVVLLWWSSVSWQFPSEADSGLTLWWMPTAYPSARCMALRRRREYHNTSSLLDSVLIFFVATRP